MGGPLQLRNFLMPARPVSRVQRALGRRCWAAVRERATVTPDSMGAARYWTMRPMPYLLELVAPDSLRSLE